MCIYFRIDIDVWQNEKYVKTLAKKKKFPELHFRWKKIFLILDTRGDFYRYVTLVTNFLKRKKKLAASITSI